MTQSSPSSPDATDPGDDQREQALTYGHGRMPLFMKIVWLSFLAFATWYVVEFLLDSAGRELGA
jgi:hypothetical protein